MKDKNKVLKQNDVKRLLSLISRGFLRNLKRIFKKFEESIAKIDIR